MSSRLEGVPRDGTVSRIPAPSARWVAAWALAGVLVAVLWSFRFVDSVIGDTVANNLLGYEARGASLSGPAMGAVFALVSGLAGTFTACNVAALSVLAPLADGTRGGSRFKASLAAIGWLALATCAVAGVYGAVGVMLADHLPQLSSEVTGRGMPVRLVQASVVFGVIGAAFVYLGLAAANLVPKPLPRLTARYPQVPLLLLGVLIGGFLIGRPFPLFRQMFAHASELGSPPYGAAAFVLQALGNIALVAILLLAVSLAAARPRVHAFLSNPRALARTASAGLLLAGSFTFFYWVFRVPSMFGYGWFPVFPWPG